MKRLVFALFAMILTSCPAVSAQDKDWEIDFKLASAKAEKGSRYLLLNFGYPTIVILNSKGDLINSTGYLAGGAKKYVEHLKAIISEYEKKKGSGIS